MHLWNAYMLQFRHCYCEKRGSQPSNADTDDDADTDADACHSSLLHKTHSCNIALLSEIPINYTIMISRHQSYLLFLVFFSFRNINPGHAEFLQNISRPLVAAIHVNDFAWPLVRHNASGQPEGMSSLYFTATMSRLSPLAVNGAKTTSTH